MILPRNSLPKIEEQYTGRMDVYAPDKQRKN